MNPMSRAAALALAERFEREERGVTMKSDERRLIIAALRFYAQRDRT